MGILRWLRLINFELKYHIGNVCVNRAHKQRAGFSFLYPHKESHLQFSHFKRAHGVITSTESLLKDPLTSLSLLEQMICF